MAADNERRMEIIRTALGDMTKFSSRIEETVRSLSEINRANEDASIEVRLSTKEMSAQATDVAATAQALSQMAKDQQVILSQFRIDNET
jgi:methyl-accepting chemotaxis protein